MEWSRESQWEIMGQSRVRYTWMRGSGGERGENG